MLELVGVRHRGRTVRAAAAGMALVLAMATVSFGAAAEAAPTQSAPAPDLFVDPLALSGPGVSAPVSVFVGNRGANATGTLLQITVPPEVAVTSAVHGWFSRPCTVATSTVTCAIGAIPTGGDRFVSLGLSVLVAGEHELDFTLSSDQADADPSDNTASIVVGKPDPDLSVAVDVDADVAVDVPFEAWLDVAHVGVASPATVATVEVSPGLVIESAAFGWFGRACAVSGATATCALGTMSNSSQFVVLRLRATEVGAPTITARVSSAGGDRNPANDADAVTVSIQGAPLIDLALRSLTSPSVVGAGGAATHQLSVTNQDDLQTATGIVVTSTAPEGFVVTSATAGFCTIAGRDVRCELPDLAPGYTRTVHIGVVAPAGFGDYELSGSVTSALPDTRPADNVASSTLVVGPPDLDVVLYQWPEEVAVDVPFVARIDTWNRGAETTDATLRVEVSPGLVIESATVGYFSVPCTITGSVATCRIGKLGSTMRFTQLGLRATGAGTHTVTAEATDPVGDAHPSNNVVEGSLTAS